MINFLCFCTYTRTQFEGSVLLSNRFPLIPPHLRQRYRQKMSLNLADIKYDNTFGALLVGGLCATGYVIQSHHWTVVHRASQTLRCHLSADVQLSYSGV